MKNFSYFFTPNQWNNSTSFSLLSSHNNAIISQLNGTKKRHLWKTVCFSFKTIPFFKRSKYHDLRNLQHENQDAKKQKQKKYLVPSSRNQRSKKSLCLYALFIMSRFYNNSFFLFYILTLHEWFNVHISTLCLSWAYFYYKLFLISQPKNCRSYFWKHSALHTWATWCWTDDWFILSSWELQTQWEDEVEYLLNLTAIEQSFIHPFFFFKYHTP